MRVVNDTVFINKIPEPEKSSLKIGMNDIIYNGVTVTDVVPDITNKLVVHSKVMDDLIIQDDILIERFGEHKEEVEAVKYVTRTETVTEESSTDTDTDSDSTPKTKTKTVTEEVPCTTKAEVESFANLYLE